MGDMASQLKKGFLEIMVLHLLKRTDLYGYQLITELDQRSRGYFKLKEGTLYPVLYRLEDAGNIRSYWEQEGVKRGVPRKYYRITEEGLHRLNDMRADLALLLESMSHVLEEDIHE
ncbi:PadR family transcriptional regulator [Gorillibacterium massiliense]|uniref:PadR family transcriptional regulator n=1 Tax=Gorillibacterium massiliense TaxID=1280390 RepID=UPI0004BA4330|nr:PadR family transcriptional regulator [Gorillibacterium massiliense]